MLKMKAHRKMIDKRLGLPTSSEVKSPQPTIIDKPTVSKATDPLRQETNNLQKKQRNIPAATIIQ